MRGRTMKGHHVDRFGRGRRHLIAGVCLALGVGSVSSGAAAPPAGVTTGEVTALRLAIEDLARAYPQRYAKGAEFLQRLEALAASAQAAPADERPRKVFADLQREALVTANPLLDFDRLLLIRRADPGGADGQGLGLPQNWQGNSAIRGNFDNEIAVLSPVRPDGQLTALFRPREPAFVGDVDLHFDADRLVFSMPKREKGREGAWHIWELRADGTGLRQVTPDEPGVDFYDACYLPDGRLVFDASSGFQGVPCVGGGDHVANLHLLDADGKIRMLCYDQDHNWNPVVMNDGRLLFVRWEYTDTPHYFTRLLFSMNPDGTAQMAAYGSNSYWPNSVFYPRPVPGHPTLVAGVISGHHGVPRMGELILFDLAKGRHEAAGVVQRIPGRGRPVTPDIEDQLVNRSWPRFLHPYPLSDTFLLVTCKPSPDRPWGIYLADVFDNLVPVLEQPGWALLEPVPMRATPRPPAIPDRIRPGEKEGTVYLADIYLGPGLAGVPRGTVKSLRVFEYHFSYRGMGGHINVGIDGPWDVHRILGTVPVREDGSAVFTVPALTPLAVQPLDAEGRAIQVMRSWFTAQPGERLSCVGCHESAASTPLPRPSIAARETPVALTPWRGPARGFSFPRDVQPVLDRRCVGCHDGTAAGRPDFTSERVQQTLGNKRKPREFGFDSAYLALHPYVRRPGPESDYRLPRPYEYFAETSELIQMLRKGHHGVQLDAEDWDRLITWIDLNVPDHGTWSEHRKIPGDYRERRAALRKAWAGVDVDLESYPVPPLGPVAFVPPSAPPALGTRQSPIGNPAGWPFDAAEAKRRQQAAGAPANLKLDLAPGVAMEMALIPAGEFPMGDANGASDEGPVSVVRIEKPFYLGRLEVDNATYRLFDPAHESGHALVFNKDHSSRGPDQNRDRMPAVRVSWEQAVRFCEWLSQRTGKRFALPTEAQWEWACRAGTTTALNYGEVGMDFGKLANLADQRVNELAPRDSPKWIPSVPTVNDGAVATENVGRYPPNAWGLCDMHGNAAEWTLSAYRPYPCVAGDGRDDPKAEGLKIVRGGSFYDRPHRARSAFRLGHLPHQAVYNVGFRVCCPAEGAGQVAVDGIRR